MRIGYTHLALERILEIAEFRYPNQPDRAQTWMGALVEYVRRLEDFPRMGQRVPGTEDTLNANVRRLLFKDVWIYWEITSGNEREEQLVVQTVRHVRERPE